MNHVFLEFILTIYLVNSISYAWFSYTKSRPRGYFFVCSTQLSTKFILFINDKMPTIVGILTFISMLNTAFERHNVRHVFSCWPDRAIAFLQILLQ